MERIGVFLSSHNELSAAYVQVAENFGAWLGQNKKTLVYGGCRAGLMETLAAAVKKNGGKVVGIVPDILRERHLVSDCCDVEMYCADLSDRKAAMERESDIMVALPGGIGTLDEVFCVAANHTIGINRKRVILCNVDGCWDKLWNALLDLQRQHLISPDMQECLTKADDLEELIKILEE